MLRNIEGYFSGNWKILFITIFFPVAWIPWVFEGDLPIKLIKISFLLLPILFLILGFWCTLISLVTVIFRPNRVRFVAIILISWWDGGKAILTYWGGILKFIFLSFGWLWGILRIVVAGIYYSIKEIFFIPFSFIKSASSNYLKPGIPWIAVLMTLGWIVLESLIFSNILTQMAIEIFAQLTNREPPEIFVTIILFLFLSIVIGGSFACMHGLVEAIKNREPGNIFKMLIVESSVMLFEVMFLYREFVDSLAPWMAQMSGIKLGGVTVILIASFAWLGIRASTWFLFAKFGTPTLLTIISREAGSNEYGSKSPTTIDAPIQSIKTIFSTFQQEINWFYEKSNELIEAFILPPVQIFAVMTNFFMIILTSRTLFNLPLKTLNDIKDTKELIDEITKHGV